MNYISVFKAMALCLTASVSASAHAITLGQVDDFQDGTVMNWGGGANPTNIPHGGPNGKGDRFVQVTGIGGAGPGSVPAMNNTSQWAGDWEAAGVKAVQTHIRNQSSTNMHMRLVLWDLVNFNRWASATAQIVPPDGQWHLATFIVSPSTMIPVQGANPGSYAQTVQNVGMILLRHQVPDDSGGTAASAQVGFDNITARAGPTVLPNAFSLFRGILVSGDLQSLWHSDNDRLVARPGLTLSTLEDPIQLIVEGEAPELTPSAIQLRVESHASTTNIRQRISLFDFTANEYAEVDSRIIPTVDTLVEITMAADPARFIQTGTNLVRARVGWRQAGPVLVFPWQARTDMVNWTIVP